MTAMSAAPTPAADAATSPVTELGTARASKKRKQPAAAGEDAAASSAAADQPNRVVIPLRNKRLRKHAALIQTPTSGFLLCCARKRETECMTSVLSLLQLYADEAYGGWVKGKDDDCVQDNTEADQTDEDEGRNEDATAIIGGPATADGERAHTQLSKHRGRFSLVSAGGVEGLAFIACNDPTVSTTQLTLRILSNLQSHSLPLPLSPHLSRLLPVHTTASATAVDHILGRFHHLTLHMFTAERVAASSATSPLTFAVVFRASNSRAVQRSEAITALAVRVEEEARKVGASVAVRLVGADISVLCWLVKSVAMLAVLPDYHTHCEYSVDKLRPGSSASNQTHAGSTKDRTSDGAPDAS